MPCCENSISPARFCSSGGNFARSFGHHAPDAPNPSIVCAGAATMLTTARCAGVVIVVIVAAVVGTGCAECAECADDEHDAASTTTTTTKIARRIAASVPRLASATARTPGKDPSAYRSRAYTSWTTGENRSWEESV